MTISKKHYIRLVFISVFLTISLAFLKRSYPFLSISDFYQPASCFLMVVALFYAELQIDEMRRSKREEREIAIISLIEEMKYNKKQLKAYIQHCEEGAHIEEKEGNVSYELTKPIFMAYEKHLILACKSNTAIIKKINDLYNLLESVKVIIELNQRIATSNIGGLTTQGTVKTIKTEILKNNSQLLATSKNGDRLINDLLGQLELIKQKK